MASLASRVTIPAAVFYSEAGEEAVLLNENTGRYYGLDETGARIWAELARHGCVEPAFRTLLAEFQVTAECLERDILSFVEELAGHDLLRIDAQ